MQNRELQEKLENALYENSIAQEFLAKGMADKLAIYLNMNDKRLRNGMTADEIDAVKKRAKEACEEWQK